MIRIQGAAMCFSATASFIAGGALTLIGAATIRQNKQPPQRLFAAIPLVFGLQQISEGFVWVGLQSGRSMMVQIAASIFLFAALMVWPTIVPLSVFLMEPAGRRRKALAVLLAVGGAATIAYGVALVVFKLTVQISGFHINYSLNAARPLAIAGSIAYLIATIPPMFITSKKLAPLFGVVVAISYVVTFIFFREYLTSVWCFFAAILSAIIWSIVRERKEIATNDV
jgi:hypothetical protein